MKHKKEVDKLFRKLALHENDKTFWAAIELKSRIIEPGFNRDIKKWRYFPLHYYQT
jgi:hypothetical protein